MNNKKITVIATIVLVILVGFSFWYSKSKNSPQVDGAENGPILFYRDDCSHCANVEKFMADNAIDTKIQIDKKEIATDAGNQKILLDKAKICKLDTSSIGVPFLWTGKECLMGDQPIIDYLKEQINVQ
ncbi:MAG: hypothetical protein Q7S18_00825 [bacterium]|nr:hypothetical protein [bacterium]